MKQQDIARKYGWRSGLEETIGEQMRLKRVPFEYEALTGSYLVPAKAHKYTPDFVLWNGIVVETKGRWLTADRQKIRLVRQQHPGLDLRMVFSRSSERISKQSRTTYADVCQHLGVLYADRRIPDEWLEETNDPDRWHAIEDFRWVNPKARKAA